MTFPIWVFLNQPKHRHQSEQTQDSDYSRDKDYWQDSDYSKEGGSLYVYNIYKTNKTEDHSNQKIHPPILETLECWIPVYGWFKSLDSEVSFNPPGIWHLYQGLAILGTYFAIAIPIASKLIEVLGLEKLLAK